MPLGERNTRAGLQTSLERNRASLVGELDEKVKRPRTVLGGMGAVAGIVARKPRRHI